MSKTHLDLAIESKDEALSALQLGDYERAHRGFTWAAEKLVEQATMYKEVAETLREVHSIKEAAASPECKVLDPQTAEEEHEMMGGHSHPMTVCTICAKNGDQDTCGIPAARPKSGKSPTCTLLRGHQQCPCDYTIV